MRRVLNADWLREDIGAAGALANLQMALEAFVQHPGTDEHDLRPLFDALGEIRRMTKAARAKLEPLIQRPEIGRRLHTQVLADKAKAKATSETKIERRVFAAQRIGKRGRLR